MGIKFNNSTGFWEAFYSKRHPITRQPVGLRRRKCTSKSEALRIEKELVIQVEDKLRRNIIPTWKALVTGFMDSNVTRQPKTMENYFLCMRAHTFQCWGDRISDGITAQEIRELIESKSDKSTSHRKSILKFIRWTFQYGVDTGLLKHNPTPQIKFRIGDKIKGVLTEKQIEILLNKAKTYDCEWYQHWAMAIYTGMRNGELYALTWDKVNLDDRKILVDCSWNNVDGFKATKSGDDRIVEIAPPLIPMLKELKLQSADRSFVLKKKKKWDKGEQARELRFFLMGLGLPVVRFHDLRASWATVMLGKGIEPIKVMSMGGWKDIKTMMIYARKAGVDIRGITDCLDLHNSSSPASADIIGLR